MISTAGHTIYLDEDDGVFTNNMCLFQKYDGSSSSSVSSYSRSSRSSLGTDNGYGRPIRGHMSRQMSSDFDQEEGNTSESRDNLNGSTERGGLCTTRFIHDSSNRSYDGDSKENTDIIPCKLCGNSTDDRHLLRSSFAKSSLCSQCSKESTGKRNISYCGSPSYERGSWRRRFRAERSIDIDLTPLLDVLEKIDNIDTRMGIPMHEYTKNLPKHRNERDTLFNVINNHTDNVNGKASNTVLLDNDSKTVISEHSLHDDIRSDRLVFAMDSTVMNINNTTSGPDNNLTKPSFNDNTSADVQLRRDEDNTNANTTNSEAEFEHIFKEAVHFNKQSNAILKQDAFDRRNTTHSVDEHRSDTDQSPNICSIKRGRNSLRRKSIRRTNRIRRPVSPVSYGSDSNRQDLAAVKCPVNKLIFSSRESTSSVTSNSDTEDELDMQFGRNRTSKGVHKDETLNNRKTYTDRRRSLSNTLFKMNTGSDSKVAHAKEKKIDIHTDVNNSSRNSHHDIENIPRTYEEFNNSLERETKSFDKKRSSLKNQTSKDGENLDTTFKADKVESTIRRKSVSKIRAFWENRLTVRPNPTPESSDSEADHISRSENDDDTENTSPIPGGIKKTVHDHLKNKDTAMATETGSDEDETFRRIQSKLMNRQSSRKSIRRESVKRNKDITSSFLNEFLTVPGARTRNSDSESGCNTSSVSIKPELTKRRFSFNSRSVTHPAFSTVTDTDSNSSDSCDNEYQANICNKSDDLNANVHSRPFVEQGSPILPAITLTKHSQYGNNSQDLTDTVYMDQDNTSRKENAENEHMLWRRNNSENDNSRRSMRDVPTKICATSAGKKDSTLKESDITKDVCKQEIPSFNGNTNEINKHIFNPEINFSMESNPLIKDDKSGSILQDKTETIQYEDNSNRTTVGKKPTINEEKDLMSVTEYADDPFENSSRIPVQKRRPKAKLFSIAGEDELDESCHLLNVPVELDSSDSSDVELSWRSRGYEADFYMSRKSTTGSEIINKFRQIVKNRSRQKDRRRLSKKGSALLTQFDDY